MAEDWDSDRRPGYRRRIRIVPRPGAVLAMLEDDIHCMAVILRYDGERVLAVESDTHRMPWTTCPGAAAQLERTFAGVPLAAVTSRREKRENCTHLHDMATLAAAHAQDDGPTDYAVLVTDPVDGRREIALWRNGERVERWLEQDGVLAAPEEVAGLTLLALREWIGALAATRQEGARILQWAALVAHGRTIPLDRQSRAADLPANCYTLQPGRAAIAERVGLRHDFSDGARVPLAEIRDRLEARLDQS